MDGDSQSSSPAGLRGSLQALFLKEPAVFGRVVREFKISPEHVNYSSKSLPEKDVHLQETAADDEGHCDDCTPSSGPDYLMETQNPNWETAIFHCMSCTLDSLSQTSSSSSSSLPLSNVALRDFSTFFVTTLTAETVKYDFSTKTVEPIEKNSLMAGKSLMTAGKVLEAVFFLENAVRIPATATEEAWILLALAQYLVQNDAQCISACKKFLSLPVRQTPPSLSLILLLLATCFSNEDDLAACQAVIFCWAVDYLELKDDIVRRFLDNSNDRQCTAKFAQQKWVPTLLRIFEYYANHQDMQSDGTLNWAMGVLSFSRDDFSTAKRFFERVLVQNAKSPSVLNQISACFHNSHFYDHALVLQDEALQLLSDFPRAIYNKAITLHAMEKTEKALLLIESALHRQEKAGLPASDQFWCLAARMVPQLSAKLPLQHRRRTRLMSNILTRNLTEFTKNLHETEKQKTKNPSTKN